MPNFLQNPPSQALDAHLPGPPADGQRTQLYSRRHTRQQRGKALGHFVPALVLVSGISALFTGEEALTPLLGLEVTVGAIYLLLMVRELRHLRHATPHHEQVAWLELAAASIIGLEGYHLWHRHHAAELAGAPHRLHLLPWLCAALAVFYVGLAFSQARLAARRYLHLHPEGFGMRTRLLSPVQEARWDQMVAAELLSPTTALLHFADGRQQQLAFDHLHDGSAHCARLVAHAHQHIGQASTR